MEVKFSGGEKENLNERDGERERDGGKDMARRRRKTVNWKAEIREINSTSYCNPSESWPVNLETDVLEWSRLLLEMSFLITFFQGNSIFLINPISS